MLTGTESRVRTRISPSFPAALAVVLLVTGLAVILPTGHFLGRSRAHYLARAEVSAQNLCAALAENLATSYEKIELAMLSVKDEAERQLASKVSDGPRLEDCIERARVRVQALEGIRTVDSNGLVTHGTAVQPGSTIDVSDREFFMRLRTDPDPGLVICKPVLGRIAPRWVMSLARRINHPDGSFAGAVQAAIELDYLTRLFSGMDLGRDGAISLRNSDLTYILRYPETMTSGDFANKKLVSPELRSFLAGGHTRGTFIGESPIDGKIRIHSISRLRGDGQWVIVGLGQKEALAGWRRECLQAGAFGGALLGVTVLGAWLVLKAWRRAGEAAEALADQEARYRSLVENAYEGIFHGTVAGTFQHLNPAVAEMFGFASPAEMMEAIRGLAGLQWRCPEDRERLEKILLENGRIDGYEGEFLRKDGTPIWLLANARLIPGFAGEAPEYEGMTLDITARKQAEKERERLIQELQKALAEVKTLSGLLPICSNCKKIRDDQGYWNQIETYIASHSSANFTHGICPECARLLYPEVFQKRDKTPG